MNASVQGEGSIFVSLATMRDSFIQFYLKRLISDEEKQSLSEIPLSVVKR